MIPNVDIPLKRCMSLYFELMDTIEVSNLFFLSPTYNTIDGVRVESE